MSPVRPEKLAAETGFIPPIRISSHDFQSALLRPDRGRLLNVPEGRVKSRWVLILLCGELYRTDIDLLYEPELPCRRLWALQHDPDLQLPPACLQPDRSPGRGRPTLQWPVGQAPGGCFGEFHPHGRFSSPPTQLMTFRAEVG